MMVMIEYPPLRPFTGAQPMTAVLQWRRTADACDQGTFAVAAKHAGDPVWRFYAPDGALCSNGLDDQRALADSFRLFPTVERALRWVAGFRQEAIRLYRVELDHVQDVAWLRLHSVVLASDLDAVQVHS